MLSRKATLCAGHMTTQAQAAAEKLKNELQTTQQKVTELEQELAKVCTCTLQIPAPPSIVFFPC